MKFKKMQARTAPKDNGLRTQKNENGGVEFVRCPLCSTPLAKNEDMFSRIYRPMNTPDQSMRWARISTLSTWSIMRQ